MRIVKITALFLALLFLLCACSARKGVHAYTEEHTHVYGYWYDATPATCQASGVRVRYCKICHVQQSMTVKVPEDDAKRAHPYEEIKVEPTEKESGSFSRVCSLCGRVDEEAGYIIPPLYALIADESTDTDARDGITAALLSDSATHTVPVLIGNKDVAIDATFAQRVSVALTALERLGADSATISQEAKNALGRWLRDGNVEALLAICAQLGEEEAQLLSAVNARMERLGVGFSTTSLRHASEFSGVTLYGTAVLIARALDEPLLAELFAKNAEFDLIGDKTPALYFVADGLRISALQKEDRYVFLVLVGASLDANVEVSFYAA